jgi:hypothetical protein
VNGLLRDLNYSVRVLLKSPVATGVAILALALGIGTNTSSFIAISSLILHPLPYPHLERIVTVWGTLAKRGAEQTAIAPADFISLRSGSHSRNWRLTGSGMPV